MAFHGTTLNSAFFRKHELQTAAALHLYCKNADAELIGEIIQDMRKTSGPALPCQGIETFLRDSPNPFHREAWREVQQNDVEWRGKAGAAYWTWRNKKTELVQRVGVEGKFVRSWAVAGYEHCLKESRGGVDGRDGDGGHGGKT